MLGKKALVSVILVAILAYYFSQPKKVREGKLTETKSGAVKGIISLSRDGREFYEWLGIPYAKPPVGRLRFASPVAVDKWEGVRDGSNYGPVCAQNNLMYKSLVAGEEDCLYLNVHRPKLQDEKKLLPILFCVHGGGYISGSSNMVTPNYFMDEDVLFVSFNYRLGILGFLTTGDKAIRGNMGLKDQVLALKWIKENARSFGGDPNSITIFGHSAGGASVHQLLLSPVTKGLFHKAISFSGGASNTWGLKNPLKSIEKTKNVAEELGCPINDSEELAKCLRNANIKDVMGTVWKDDAETALFFPHKFGNPVVPTIELVNDEEAFLTEHPLKVISQGKSNKVPWMVGYASHEGFMTSIPLRDEKILQKFEDNLEESLKFMFSIDSSVNASASEKASKLRDLYLPPSKRLTMTLEEKMEAYIQLFGDSLFNFDIREAILYQRQFSSVYPYLFSKNDGPGYMGLMEILLGDRWSSFIEAIFHILKTIVSHSVFGMEPPEDPVATHATDMLSVYPFLLFGVPRTSKHYKFSKDYVKLIVDFAIAKDESSVAFRGVNLAATPKTGPLKFFEFTNDIPRVIAEPFQERMDFLHSLKIRDYSS